MPPGHLHDPYVLDDNPAGVADLIERQAAVLAKWRRRERLSCR